jgi:hypothetical protein
MAAELEEVIVASNALEAEQFLPDRGDRLFRRADGGFILAARDGRLVRRRQRVAVELAVRRQRQRIQRDERTRQHVVRQVPRQLFAQRGRRRRVAVFGHHVCDQALAARRVVARDHRRLAHVRASRQPRFDLAEFDPESADLHLEIVAAEVFEVAVRQPAAEVAGLVHARADLARERIVEETLGREFGSVQIAARDAGAADVDLAGHADRHRRAARVEHVDARVGDRNADRNRSLARFGAAIRGRPDRAFGRTVRVEQAIAARPSARRRRQRFAGEDENQTRVGDVLVRERHQRRRRQRGMGDAARKQRVQQRFARTQRLARRQMQARAARQRHHDLEQARVEAQGRELQDLAVGLDRERPRLRGRQIAYAAMLDHHALRLAGRTRRVDHVGETARMRRVAVAVGIVLRPRRDPRRVVAGIVEHERARRIQRRQALHERGLRQQCDRRAVAEHVGEAVARIRRIERHVGAAGLQDAEHADHHIEAALHADRDAIVGSDAHRPQLVRELVRATVQRIVAELPAVERERDRIRSRGRLRLEQPVQRRILRIRGVGRVEALQHLRALGGRQQRQVHDATRIVGDHRREQRRPMPEHALHGGAVEQVGRVDHAAEQAVGRVGQRQREIELRGLPRRLDRRQRQSRQAQLAAAGRVVQRQQHLEHRAMAQAALGLQRFDDLFERQVLMRVGAERGRLDLREQLGDARIGGEIHA